MVKLYYTPTSCGAASFISAVTAGLTHIETEQVVLSTHKTESGADFNAINPKGNVPALVLDDGTVLNENSAVLQWIADQKPEAHLAAPYGTAERYSLQVALSYISSEFHATMGQLFNPTISAEIKEYALKRTHLKLQYIEGQLIGDKHFLVGGHFTVADAYLYIVLSWTGYLQIDLTAYPRTQAYYERVKSLPNVQEGHARIATNPAHI
jgi:glutathione S-transferase